MNDTTKSVLCLVALFIGGPLLILWLRDRVSGVIWRWRNPPEKLAADRRAYAERLSRPDWAFYARHLCRPVPPALRELYADRSLVTAQDLDYKENLGISSFEPLDEQSLLDTQAGLGFDAVAIATSDAGDLIYLRPGPSEADTVYITYHDGGDTEVFAESVAALVAKLRASRQAQSE